MKSSTPFVSIIIPVYNGSNYLKEAIDSALGQTYKNLEVIVINDGSQDSGKTEKIAKSYGKKIRYFLKKNGGVATALNSGISKMKGEWFSWLSHDDVYKPDKIEKQINLINSNNKIKIVYSNYELVDQNLKHLHNVSVEPKNNESMSIRLLHSYPLNGCTMLISKKCFDKCGTFNPKLKMTQDYDLWFRFSKKYNYHFLKINAIKSRQHNLQGSHSNNHKVEVDKLYLKFLTNISNAEIVREFGDKSGFWLLQMAIEYKSRGYIRSPMQAMKMAAHFMSLNSPMYIYARIYCNLPSPLLVRIADIEHHLERKIFKVHGIVKEVINHSKLRVKPI